LDQNSTIIAVIEMSQSSWLVAGMLPGIERQPRKKLEPSPDRLLGLLHRWQDEAVRVGRTESLSGTGSVMEATKVRLEAVAYLPGTDGSNPSPSTGESANHRSLSGGWLTNGHLRARRDTGGRT
jgi:hypothetical protein